VRRHDRAALIREHRRLRARHRRPAELRLDEVRDAVVVRVVRGRPDRSVDGIRRSRRREERARIAGLAQVVARRREPPVGGREHRAREVTERDERARAVVAAPEQAAQLEVALRCAVDRLRARFELKAIEPVARHEVHHARDGLGAVERSRAVFEQLDLLERDHRRQGRRVDEVLAAIRRGRALHLAAAVHEHQRRAHAEPAEVHVARAGGLVLRKRIGVVLRAGVDREPVDHVADFARAGGREVFGRENHDGRRRVELRRALDVGAEHDHLVSAPARALPRAPHRPRRIARSCIGSPPIRAARIAAMCRLASLSSCMRPSSDARRVRPGSLAGLTPPQKYKPRRDAARAANRGETFTMRGVPKRDSS
jgi:hypothetical protein